MIYIWVRHTVPWSDERAFNAQLDPDFKPRVDLWNRTLDPPFHVFRERVREIARQNLAAVEGATVAEWNDIPDGAIVVPVHDDDWLAPGIGVALEAVGDAVTVGWRWPPSFIEVPMDPGHRLYLLRRRLLPMTPEVHYCSTNNYAVRKGLEECRGAASSHEIASQMFSAWRPAGAVAVMDGALSAINRSLASTTSLRRYRGGMTRRQIVRKRRLYARLYDRALPVELSWCAPYVEQMGALTERVSVRTEN